MDQMVKAMQAPLKEVQKMMAEDDRLSQEDARAQAQFHRIRV